MAADREGNKELLAITDGYRESKQSWSELRREVQGRGLKAPCLAIADGALGFWAGAPGSLSSDPGTTLLGP